LGVVASVPLKTVLRSNLGEGGFCSWESKHDSRTAPRPKLFVSARRLQEQKSQPRKCVLGSSTGKDSFVCI
jgi:hypothetical protein